MSDIPTQDLFQETSVNDVLLLQKGYENICVDINQIPLHRNLENKNDRRIFCSLLELQSNINLNAVSIYKITPFFIYYCIEKDEEIIKILVKNRAEAFASDKYSFGLSMSRPLYMAYEIKYFVGARFLLEQITGVFNHDFFLNAIKIEDNCETVKFVFAFGCDINKEDPYGWTVLHHAVITKNNTETVAFLLENGADPNAENEDGKTPLFLCLNELVRFESTEKLQHNKAYEYMSLLVQYGADINKTSENKFHVLFYATLHKKAELVKWILKLGADIDAPYHNGKSALTLAIINQFEAMVKLLINHGANVNRRGEYDETSLSTAIYVGNKSIVKHLLYLGADFFCNSEFIQILYAKSEGNSQVFEALHISLDHLLKRKVLNLVDNSVLSLWKSVLNDMQSYEKDCKKEVEKLRTEMICSERNLTFLDFLTKDFSTVAVYLSLDDVVERIHTLKFHKEFPIYSDMLKSKIMRCKDLAKLLTESYKSLQILLNDERIPHVFLLKTLSYLNKSELQNLKAIESNVQL